MNALKRLSLALLFALPCAAASAEPRLSGQLQLAGSSTMAPLMTEIAKRFQTLHPEVRIAVRMGGSGRGVSDARAGTADIGMVSRALSEGERDLYGVPIARDGVAVIVHRDNPVAALSERQLVDIYTGKIVNWREVGGRDASILVLAGPPQRGSSELFVHYLRLGYEQFKAGKVVGDNAERIEAVAADAHAIVYVSLGEAERDALAGVPIKLLPAGGVAASSRSVRRGDFPISRPLTLVAKGAPTGLARDFVEFCLSSQVTDIIRTLDFVPYLD